MPRDAGGSGFTFSSFSPLAFTVCYRAERDGGSGEQLKTRALGASGWLSR